MKIKTLKFRNFRGLSRVDLENCSNFNVLIGKNNSGKSTILAGIDILLNHLKNGRPASERLISRPEDQFTNREVAKAYQIGAEFICDDSVIEEIRDKIGKSSPGLEKAAAALTCDRISVVFQGFMSNSAHYVSVQQLGLGEISDVKGALRISENVLIDIPLDAARGLASAEVEIKGKRKELEAIDRALAEVPTFDYLARASLEAYPASRVRQLLPGIGHKVIEAAKASKNQAEFDTEIVQIKSGLETEIFVLEAQETPVFMTGFTGNVRVVPEYITWIMRRIGEPPLLHFRENRPAIGVEEAQQLLALKTQRGGSARLETVQKTVRTLLGVTVDAFMPDANAPTGRGRRDNAAEMDVDEFLVTANGAGIREALRIILDVELKNPAIALIEEPEVHLHPGLERALHSYLTAKRDVMQMFVSTHSTNFIDVSDEQSVYILSRDDKRLTHIEQVSNDQDFLRIPEEVGLRPSTVLMFDRLTFVEGPSDEDTLKAWAKILGVDIAGSTNAFIKMGGSGNFSHYAAEATLDLLSRRQIPMIFVLDRDERSDEDIEKMVQRLGNRADLVALKRRELENYLLDDAEAVATCIAAKLETAKEPVEVPRGEAMRQKIQEVAHGLRERVIDLSWTKELFSPVYPGRLEGDATEKLKASIAKVEDRLALSEEIRKKIAEEVGQNWPSNALSVVPGSLILDELFKSFGLRYDKLVDAKRIAGAMSKDRIDKEIRELLGKLA